MLRRRKTFGIDVAVLMVLAFVAVVAASPAVTAGAEKATMQPVSVRTISGTVVDVSGNTQGIVTNVAIRTENEGDFQVGKKGKEPELLAMVGKKVEATGNVYQFRGRMTISVSEYKAVE